MYLYVITFLANMSFKKLLLTSLLSATSASRMLRYDRLDHLISMFDGHLPVRRVIQSLKILNGGGAAIKDF